MDFNQNNYVEEIVQLIHSHQDIKELSELLENYHENDIADALEYLTVEERDTLYEAVGIERASDILAYLEDPEPYFKELDLEFAADILENMDSDDAVDVLESFNDEFEEKLVNLIDDESSHDIKLIQSYDDDELGSKMTTNFIMIKKGLTIRQAMKEMITQAEDNDNIYTVYVCNEDGSFYGALDLKDLIVARDYVDLEELISHAYPYVYATDKVSESLDKIRDYAEDSIPVLDENNCILGVITAQDIIEAVDDEMSEDYAMLAGLTEGEDLNEPLLDSMRKRLPWLVILLGLGIGVSAVVGLFEAVVAQIAVIVCFQSLILGMAGNVGTQSLAVTIRVLMDENLEHSQKISLVFKEMRVGFCNGLILGMVSFLFIGVYVWLFKQYPPTVAFAVSGCVGIALMIAMVISSAVGTLIPMIFNKLKIDPAVASGPLITTINDLVAVVSYYGLAWILLINVMGM